jgi:Polyketide cyclase / dehydrase and lipid transport
MPPIHVSADGIVDAPAEEVYSYLADYRQHHPRFLPPAFSHLEVQSGGIGAGTVFNLKMNAGGRSRKYRMHVAEPESGRVITESDMDSSLVTTFTVTGEGERRTRVRIESGWEGAGGVGGFFERLFAPRLLRRLYADELQRLDQYARERSGPPQPE